LQPIRFGEIGAESGAKLPKLAVGATSVFAFWRCGGQTNKRQELGFFADIDHGGLMPPGLEIAAFLSLYTQLVKQEFSIAKAAHELRKAALDHDV
jgi:hypothetical protein